MLDTLIASQDAARAEALVAILARHGFGDLLRRLGLGRVLHRATGPASLARAEAWISQPVPVRIRHALEEMGPCFVKLGQVLATRVDLFPPDWIAEFSRLQSAAPAVPFEAIRDEIEAALGCATSSAFPQIDPTPLAAASIAQVHRARLHDGREVIVKVRRPGIRRIVEADLRLLQFAARRIETRFPELQRFHPLGMVRQFRDSLMRELDLAAECRNAERIAASFADDPRLVVPAVYWPCSNERMNVQDFVDGLPVADLVALQRAGVDRKAVARTGAQLVLRMMLEDGFFHADPHPGNVFVLRDGRIAVIDFGMVGHLSRARRREVVQLLFGLVERDAGRAGGVLLDWAGRADDVDTDALMADIDAFIDRYHGLPLAELDLSGMLLEVTTLLRQYRLALPADLALLIKVCLTLDGLGRSLDPDFDMARQARPFLRRAMARRYRPRELALSGVSVMEDVLEVVATAPRELRRLLRMTRGRGGFRMQVDGLRDLSRDVSHSANRLAGSMVIAALIVGSSIAMTVEGGPTMFGLPLFGLLGFVGASLAGIWLLWSIFRSGGGR